MKSFLALLLLPLALQAQAQDSGTYEVYFQPLSIAGKLEGCSLVFTGLVRDFFYSKGAQVIVNGSIGYRTLNRPDSLMFAAKLGTKPLMQGGGSSDWVAPSHFHFATKSASSAGKGKLVDGEPGYRLLVTHADRDMLRFLEEMVDAGGFVVGFNRKPGGQDVLLRIQLDVSVTEDASGNTVQVRNEETVADFMTCIGQLVSAIKK